MRPASPRASPSGHGPGSAARRSSTWRAVLHQQVLVPAGAVDHARSGHVRGAGPGPGVLAGAPAPTERAGAAAGSGRSWPCPVRCSRARAAGLVQADGRSAPGRRGGAGPSSTARRHHRGRADEAAQAGAVRTEDHRHVAGEVYRADGVGVVVDVGRMQPGFAAVGAGPVRLGSDQADAGAAGVVVHLPVGGEEGLDVVVGEEVGAPWGP